MTPFPPEGVDAGATNTPNPNPDAPDRVQAVSGDLRAGSSWAAVEALAALLEPEAFDPSVSADDEWRKRTQDTALGYAAKVIMSGYRRVVEDDATVKRLMWVIAAQEDYYPGELSDAGKALYSAMARAVVRALREET